MATQQHFSVDLLFLTLFSYHFVHLWPLDLRLGTCSSSITWILHMSLILHVHCLTVDACMRNSYSSLSSVITSSDTRADDGQLLSGLFLFNVNLVDQMVG